MALSGGGHRASLFGLGTLLYLVDAEVNTEVSSIASVSGGSLTNAYVGQTTNFQQVAPSTFESEATTLATQLARKGTLFAAPLTWVFLIAALLIALPAVFAVWWLPWSWSVRLPVFVVALMAWGMLFEQRGRICGLAFAKTLLSRQGKPTLLKDLAALPLQHVICATELHSGQHVYFAGSFICSYEFGWGSPGSIRLASAVQASSALPGAFPVKWLRTRRFKFVAGSHQARAMALTDGGVYDNMSDQWAQNVADRKSRWGKLAASLQEPETLIVVNASAPMQFGSVASLRFPVLGELIALLRDKSVLYDNGTKLRRHGLIGRFDRAELEGKGLRGALVHIPQSPFKVLDAFKGSTAWPKRAERARAALTKLAGESPEEWERIAAENSRVKTTLSKVGTDVAAQLLRHSYVLAMTNLHVILGLPLLDVPPMSRFIKMAGGTP